MDPFTLDKLEFNAIRQILARYCRCALGRGLAERIGPSRRPETVRQWLEATTQMIRAVREDGPPPFGGITDIREVLARASPGGSASGADFATIAAALEGAGNVKAWGQRLTEANSLVKELAGRLPDFAAEVADIRGIIDARGDVMDAASETLSRTRRAIAQTRQRIHEVIYGYVRRPEVSRILQNPTVTLHDDRFVLPVKAEHRHELPGVVHRASQTGATLFVEPAESVEMNNRLVELSDEERREIARLLSELAIRVHHRREDIALALRTLGQLDLLAAKAHYAAEFEFTVPEIVENGALQLHQARHPLLIEQARQEERGQASGTGPQTSGRASGFRLQASGDGTLAVSEARGPRPEAASVPEARSPKPLLSPNPEARSPSSEAAVRHPVARTVVPIDVRLGMDFDVLIITGSNTGGKTVALKTVGLVALMAQSGLLIPAQRGSVLPVFRNVLLDVGDEQSLQQSLSTFGAHIRRVNHVLRTADRYSLVLLDELGAGTDPDEGAALGQAVLDALGQVGCMTMVTTHLGALKAYAINHPRVDNASVEFDTRTLRPTYHLRIGEPGESHAITVASAMGLPKPLIQSARQYVNEKTGALRRAIAATSASRRASEAARAEAHTARLAAQSAQEQYAGKLAELQRLQGSFEAWLASLAELRPGDEVNVPQLGKTGRLARVQFNKQIALVDVENVQVEVPLAELMPDLGQSGVRQEIANLREQILSQARQSDVVNKEAQRLHAEYQRALAQQRAHQQQYEGWLSALASAKVGQEVPFARPPGRGKLVELDFPHSQAALEIPEGTVTVPIQELFPQTGPFAVHRRMPAQSQRRPQPPGRPRPQRREDPNRPLRRRSPDSTAAKANRQAVLAVQPGQQVYVVPFHKRATLIRFNEDKDQATVQSGAFEMQIPVADLEPTRDN